MLTGDLFSKGRFLILRFLGGVCILWAFVTTIPTLAQNLWAVGASHSLLHAAEALPPAIVWPHPRQLLWAGKLAQIRGDAETALRDLTHYTEVRSEDPLGWAALGDACKAHGNWECAIVGWKRAGLFPHRRTDAMDLAGTYEREDKWKQAALIYQTVLQENPSDAVAHSRLGWALYQSGGNHSEAVTQMRIGLALASRALEAYEADTNNMRLRLHYHIMDAYEANMKLGVYYHMEGQYQDALPLFQRAARLRPDVGWPVAMQGEAALAMQDPETAIAILVPATTNPSLANPHVFRVLASAYRMNNDPDQAIAAIEQALALDPSGVFCWIYAGQIYEWAGYPQKAAVAYREALRIDPSNRAVMKAFERVKEHLP